jgi:hypothetical protein
MKRIYAMKVASGGKDVQGWSVDRELARTNVGGAGGG